LSQTKKDATEEKQGTTVAEGLSAPVFAKEDLIEVAIAVFGVQPEVLIGALREIRAPITVVEAKAKLREFLVRPVVR
jgi:hypothetical protein